MEIDFKNYKMNFLRFFTEDEMSFLSKTKGEIHTQNFSRIFFALDMLSKSYYCLG